MPTFTFQTTTTLPSAVLAKKTTAAAVEFRVEPGRQIFVPAHLEASADGETWRVTVQPVSARHGHVQQAAVLHVTKGELGNPLGAVKLQVV